jgi:phage tail-like protein
MPMIDVNRQKFRMLSSAGQFDLSDPAGGAEWSETRRVLRLKSTRSLEDLPQDRIRARALSDQLPVTLDDYGTWARVDETEQVILGGGVFPDPVEIARLDAGERVLDMAMNPEGILYVIGQDAAGLSTIYLINLKGSKEDGKTAYRDDEETSEDTNVAKGRVPAGENQPDRIVALAGGGALLLDREHNVFWQIVGKPYRSQPTAMYPPRTPRPCADGPRPQELIDRPDLKLPAGFQAVAMASNPRGETAVLLFADEVDQPAAVVLISGGEMSAPVFLDQARAPFSIGWIKDDEWALLFEDKKEAFGYGVPFLSKTPENPVTVTGRRYPLNRGPGDGQKNGRFCNAPSRPVYYPSTDKQGNFLIRPLYSLSFPSYAKQAEVRTAALIDSGEPNTVWHRLVLEACLPKGTGVIVSLAAGEDKDALAAEPQQWAAHHFGAVAAKPGVPKGVWIDDTSEVPFFPGLLDGSSRAGISGVFGVLVQRAGYIIRTLKGRYLNIKITLLGGGQATPEIAALRIYHPRFSYLDRYLPELYRETDVREKTDKKGTAGGSDFLQRFLCLFESVLTPLEDRVAASYMLTNPRSAPSEALDWLGQWIGLSGDADLSEDQKRLYIRYATDLYRKRGTLKGLELALDLMTGNMVSRGDIVLLEDFRLRRTFATILGADFSTQNDPLLMADIPNANSYVGETLFLGEEEKKEFLALYARDLPLNTEDEEAVAAFYARLSNRLTVLVHRDTGGDTLKLIRRVVRMETPAHIEYRVLTVSKPLIIGLYALLGVDTYLQREPERRIARVGHSYVGRYDFIRKLPVLDERLEP